MLCAGIIAFECILIGFIVAGRKRKELFTDNPKIKEKYGEEHQKHFNADLPKGGAPDHGDGLYSDCLSYKDWMRFTLDQRSHKNFLEGVTIVVFLILVIGLVFPITSLVFAGIHIVCRVIFVVGYAKGPAGRYFGGMPINISTMIMGVLGLVSCCMLIAAIPKA